MIQTDRPVAGTQTETVDKRHWLWDPIVIYLTTRVGIFVLTTFGPAMLPLKSGQRLDPLSLGAWVAGLTRWDTGWYLAIVYHGYYVNPKTHVGSVAFYPLYPILISVVSRVVGNPPLVAVIISNLAFLGALIVLYHLIATKFDRIVARQTIVFLCVFPYALFYSAAYTESLFLITAALSFWYAEREHWWRSGLAGMFCALSRPTGLIVAPAILLIYLQRRKYDWRQIDWKILACCLVGVGTLLYAGYLGIRFGDPLASVKATTEGWGHFNIFVGGQGRLNPAVFHLGDYDLVLALNVLVTVLWIIATIPVYRLMGPGYAIFVLLGAAIPITTGIESLGRYVSILFPVFVLLAYHLRDRFASRMLIVGCAMILGVFAALYASGYWII